MTQPKTFDSKKLLQIQLKNDSFRQEYEKFEEEFAIAKQVIRLRKKLNITQKQLAKKAGTSQPAIARLESGEYRNLTLSFLRKIGNVLGAFPEVHFKKFKN
ncbi:MAG: helix-turn-helix domain-containing protein [Candidatus Aminicenantes bacterium]|nr:helix-turn-helix domain-containing protein [Candidatus Aminicenantes bacterium]